MVAGPNGLGYMSIEAVQPTLPDTDTSAAHREG